METIRTSVNSEGRQVLLKHTGDGTNVLADNGEYVDPSLINAADQDLDTTSDVQFNKLVIANPATEPAQAVRLQEHQEDLDQLITNIGSGAELITHPTATTYAARTLKTTDPLLTITETETEVDIAIADSFAVVQYTQTVTTSADIVITQANVVGLVVEYVLRLDNGYLREGCLRGLNGTSLSFTEQYQDTLETGQPDLSLGLYVVGQDIVLRVINNTGSELTIQHACINKKVDGNIPDKAYVNYPDPQVGPVDDAPTVHIEGAMYYCTDLDIPIYANYTDAWYWVNAAGGIVKSN